MRAVRLLLAAVLAGCFGAGCNGGRVFIASPGDYADYRAVRLAGNLDDRVAAAHYYLRSRPGGRYSARLSKYFGRVEPLYYRVRSRNIAGLQAYLRALPDGPHAAEGLELLTVLRTESRREALISRQARRTGMHLDAERKERQAAAELLAWWVRSLLAEQLWRAPLSEAPGELLVRFRLALPAPRCTADDPLTGWQRCSKRVQMDYPIAGRRARQRHAMSLDIELVLDRAWRVASATLSGPALFVRADEARAGKLRDASDPVVAKAARERFGKWLTELVFATGRECNGGGDEQGATTLSCEGVRLTVMPGPGDDDDVLWFERLAALPSRSDRAERSDALPANQ